MDELKVEMEPKLDKQWHIFGDNTLTLSVTGYSQREWDVCCLYILKTLHTDIYYKNS